MSLQLPTDLESLRQIHDACETFETNHAIFFDALQVALEIRWQEVLLVVPEWAFDRGCVVKFGSDLEDKLQWAIDRKDRETGLSVTEPYLAWPDGAPRDMANLVDAVRGLNRRAAGAIAQH